MLNTIWTWLQATSSTQRLAIGMIGVGVVGYIVTHWSTISAGWAKLTASSASTTNTDSTDVLDLKALERVAARADRRNCPEMKAAVQMAQMHFFHGSEPTPLSPITVNPVSVVPMSAVVGSTVVGPTA